MHFHARHLVTHGLALTGATSESGGLTRRTITGSNTNGSIFMFGSATACRTALRTYGACGISTYFNSVDPNTPLVAMPADVFDKYGSAQHNTLCGRVLTLKRNGVTRQVIVADRNLSVDHSIDMCLDTWQAFGGHDLDGTLIKGFSWSVGDNSSPTPTSTRTSTPTTAPCSWEGHCAGASCASDDDCSDSLVCANGKCSLSSGNGVSTTTKSTPTPTPVSCSWAGHCAGASCNDDNDCSDALSCVKSVCTA